MPICPYHKKEHPKSLLDEYTRHCKRLGITVGKDCPILLCMEKKPQLKMLESTYTIIPKPVTEVSIWPRDIALLITSFPVTEKEGFSRGLAGFVANKAFSSMNNNSLLYLVVPSLKEGKERPFALVDIFTSVGFQFIDTIIWLKNRFVPTQGTKRLNNVFEFVFMFSKGDSYHLNRESISYLKKDSIPDCVEDYVCPGNCWRVKVDQKDATPTELYECMIKLSNILPNSTIVDPFVTGPTLKAALQQGHSFWGCTDDKRVLKDCKEIIDKMKK